jgi:mRNA interferase MazF
MPAAARGDVWLSELGLIRGHEQAGRRPVLIVSVDRFNDGPAHLVLVIPITSRERRIRTHVAIQAGDGGLDRPSFAMCENLRSIATSRLVGPLGVVTPPVMRAVSDHLRMLLGL